MIALLGFAHHALAQGFTALAPIPGLTDISPTSVVNSDTLVNFFNNLYKYLIGLAATLAVIQIIWAGLDIAYFHKDSVSEITNDKGKIYNAIFGLILVLSPVLVFTVINPSILNLNLDLPPLNLNVPAVTDANGNPITYVDQSGNSTTTETNGNTTTIVTDVNGNTTRITTDANGKVLETTNLNAACSSYTAMQEIPANHNCASLGLGWELVPSPSCVPISNFCGLRSFHDPKGSVAPTPTF